MPGTSRHSFPGQEKAAGQRAGAAQACRPPPARIGRRERRAGSGGPGHRTSRSASVSSSSSDSSSASGSCTSGCFRPGCMTLHHITLKHLMGGGSWSALGCLGRQALPLPLVGGVAAWSWAEEENGLFLGFCALWRWSALAECPVALARCPLGGVRSGNLGGKQACLPPSKVRSAPS